MRSPGALLAAVLRLGVVAMLAPLGACAWHTGEPEDPQERVGPRLNLSESPGHSAEPDMATAGDRVYVVFQDERSGGGDVYLRKSEDGGQHFGEALLVGGGEGAARRPRLAVQEEHVFVAWAEVNAGIRFRASADGAQSFGPTVTLAEEGSRVFLAAACCEVFVAWSAFTAEDTSPLYFRASHDCGGTFDVPLLLHRARILPFQLLARGSNVFIVGDDSFTNDVNEVFLARSTDAGRTFGPFENLSQSPSESSEGPRIALQEDSLTVVWQECRVSAPRGCEVVLRRSSDNGSSFDAPVVLSGGGGTAARPELAADGEHLYVVWQDAAPGNAEIFLRASGDRGGRFGPAQNLSNSPGESSSPAIQASQRVVRVVWEDATPGASDVFYRASNDAAEHFGLVRNLSESPTSSRFPRVLSSGAGLNGDVLWLEEDGDISEVYFRSTSGGR